MEPTACRERLTRLIAEEESALGELAALLAREHESLVANDLAALDETIRERQRRVVRVVRCDEARRTLCRELGRPADVKGLEEILRWCDPAGTLATGWARCSAAAARCRALNDGNGALVGARLKHVQARLAALVQVRGDLVTYGRHGTHPSGGLGRVVKVEA